MLWLLCFCRDIRSYDLLTLNGPITPILLNKDKTDVLNLFLYLRLISWVPQPFLLSQRGKPQCRNVEKNGFWPREGLRRCSCGGTCSGPLGKQYKQFKKKTTKKTRKRTSDRHPNVRHRGTYRDANRVRLKFCEIVKFLLHLRDCMILYGLKEFGPSGRRNKFSRSGKINWFVCSWLWSPVSGTIGPVPSQSSPKSRQPVQVQGKQVQGSQMQSQVISSNPKAHKSKVRENRTTAKN